MRASMLGLAVAIAGCSEPAGGSIPLAVEAFQEPDGGQRFAGAVTFADGTRVEDVVVGVVPIAPGRPTSLRFRVQGEPSAVIVALQTPHTVARQVAVGGVDAPEPRARLPEAEGAVRTIMAPRGEVSMELTAPPPWHPTTAVLTLEVQDGVAAIGGARTADGLGILAVVPVDSQPTVVSAVRVATPPIIDGSSNDAAWGQAQSTALVGSLDGAPIEEGIATRVRLAWDDIHLYVAADMRDPDVWATHREHDAPLWKEEVFEVFVFGDTHRRDYLELQVSPRGMTFDARFSRHRQGDEAWDSRMSVAAVVDGTLDERHDRDRSWTVEMAIPWREVCDNTPVACPVAAGTRLRFNTFRFERPRQAPAVGQALSPTRVPDFHAPENAAMLELAP
jgi:hypothetical protein